MKKKKAMLGVDKNSWNWVIGNKGESLIRGKQYLVKTTYHDYQGCETGVYYFIKEPYPDYHGVLCFDNINCYDYGCYYKVLAFVKIEDEDN